MRFYLIPPGPGTMGPLYLHDLGINIWSASFYGPEGIYLVGAYVTDAQHVALSSNADVYAIPPLTQAVGGNPTMNQTRNQLENRQIPGSWIQSTTLYREVVRRTFASCQILLRLWGGQSKRIFEGGVTLGTTLTPELRDSFIDAGQSFDPPLDTAGITTAITVRTALLLLGDQLPPLTMGDEVF